MSYYSENREKVLAYNKEWRKNNNDKVLKHRKKYRDNPKNRAVINEAQRRFAKKYPDKVRKKASLYNRTHLLQIRARAYKISVEELTRLLSESEGKCDICKKETPKMNVDHCHSTGKVRGVLCRDCNLAIGLFKDSKQILSQAINYLDKTGQI